MCNQSCIEFGSRVLLPEEMHGRDVVEVGSLNVNGSLRSLITRFAPSSYRGLDITHGPGVDEICDIDSLVARLGVGSTDLVVCTEVLEHVLDWRSAISNLKAILRTNGVLLITTRSVGFAYHGYPFDYWRYELSDMQVLLSDMIIEHLESDPSDPGVMVKARKPMSFVEFSSSDHALYSIIKGERSVAISRLERLKWRGTHPRMEVARILPPSLKKILKTASDATLGHLRRSQP